MLLPDWMDYVDRVEAGLAGSGVTKPADMRHRFADGMYMRECDLLEGDILTTIPQKKSYSFILLEGSIAIRSEEGIEIAHAPYHKIVPANSRRIVYSLTDSRAITHHPTQLTSVTEIQNELLEWHSNPYLTDEQKAGMYEDVAIMNLTN